MKLKGCIDEDFANFKQPSFFIIFPYCSFKCDKEYGNTICQNSSLANAEIIEFDTKKLVERYLENPITKAVVCGGLEPLDSGLELLLFISIFRKYSDDPIIIYTGYNKEEILPQIDSLKEYKNIIIKYGRFIPNAQSRYDEILGITLASDNQYAEVISWK